MNINGISSQFNSKVYRTSINNTSSVNMAGTSVGDSVSISSKALITGLLSNFMDGAGADGVITLDEIKAFRDKEIGITQSQLQDTLIKLKIKPSGRLKIDIDSSNEVIVSGGSNEENSAIAAALQKDNEFINAWHAASGTSSMLAAAKASIPFQNAYRSDSKSAVAQYSWLFNRDWTFNMYFENGKIDCSVT